MTRSTNDRLALAAMVLLSALSDSTPSAAQPVATSPAVDSPSFRTDAFSLGKADESFLLHVTQDGQDTHVAAWGRVALGTLRNMIKTKNRFDRQVKVCTRLKLGFRFLGDIVAPPQSSR